MAKAKKKVTRRTERERLAKELLEVKEQLDEDRQLRIGQGAALAGERTRRIEAEKEVKELRNVLYWNYLVATHNAVALAALRQACGLISQREAMVRVESALREFWTDRQKLFPEDDGKFMPRVPVVQPPTTGPGSSDVTVTEWSSNLKLVPVGEGLFKLVDDAPEKKEE